MKTKKIIKILLFIVFGITTLLFIVARFELVKNILYLLVVAVFTFVTIKYIVGTITGREGNENPYADIGIENREAEEHENIKDSEKNNKNSKKRGLLSDIFDGMLLSGIWLFTLLICTIILTCNSYSDYDIVKPDDTVFLDRIERTTGISVRKFTKYYDKFMVKYEYDGEEYQKEICINVNYLEGIFVEDVDLYECLYLFVNDEEALPFWQTFVKRAVIYHVLFLITSISICWLINTNKRVKNSEVILDEKNMLLQKRYLIINRIILLSTIAITFYLLYLTADFYNLVILGRF